jgi:hypothetical protein
MCCQSKNEQDNNQNTNHIDDFSLVFSNQKASIRYLLLCKIQSYQEKNGNQTLNFDVQELKLVPV